jgi:uncharacterized membrane protein YgcG
MGFFDRLFGGQDDAPQVPAARRRSDDEIAVERYEYLLRTAPPETIEKVHAEAFSRLTPQQRDILFEKLTATADASERPADAAPATLATAATRAELQQPGTLSRTLGGSAFGGAGLGGTFASSLLGSVAGYVIGSAIVSSFLPAGDGTDASADATADSSATDSSVTDSSVTDSSGWDGGSSSSGGDFGGGDFGGF